MVTAERNCHVLTRSSLYFRPIQIDIPHEDEDEHEPARNEGNVLSVSHDPVSSSTVSGEAVD